MVRVRIGAAVGLAVAALAGCGIKQPTCGDADAVAAVIAEVKARPVKLLMALRDDITKQRIGQCTAAANGRLREKAAQMLTAAGKEADVASLTMDSSKLCDSLPDKEGCSRLFLEAINLDDAPCRLRVVEEVARQAEGAAAFAVDSIRFKRADKENGAQSCAARLHATVPELGTIVRDITYTAERTSDGKAFVTVDGLD